jgi:energy-converting hydrogenase A subunit R
MFTTAFDLEGPLSPQDNAYEVMQLIDNGRALFETISKYDDYLTSQNRPNYEPGDTLKLIVPFMLVSGATEEDVKKVSKQAKIVCGAKELIKWLQEDAWDVHIISTSYEQHAHGIASQLGVAYQKVHCTSFPLDSFAEMLGDVEKELIRAVQEEILSFYFNVGISENQRFKEFASKLDRFFFEQVPRTRIKAIFDQIKVVGGERKVRALMKAIGDSAAIENTAVTGDSITDYKMLQKVCHNGGLSIVFNGNIFALPYGNVGVACTDLRPLYPIFAAFRERGLKSAFDVAAEWEDKWETFVSDPALIPDCFMRPELRRLFADVSDDAVFPRFNLLNRRDEKQLRQIALIHKRFRRLVRGESTARLG